MNLRLRDNGFHQWGWKCIIMFVCGTAALKVSFSRHLQQFFKCLKMSPLIPYTPHPHTHTHTHTHTLHIRFSSLLFPLHFHFWHHYTSDLTSCLTDTHYTVRVKWKFMMTSGFGSEVKCQFSRVSFHLFAFSFSWATLACPSLAWTSRGLSKKLTMAGSFSREARTCSNENDHSTSDGSGPAFWLLWVLEVSELSGVLEASSVEDSSAAEALVGFVDSGGLLGSCSLRPTSSILRSRLVTWATARYRASSSGSPWKMLYRVLENWMNWVWDEERKKKAYVAQHQII